MNAGEKNKEIDINEVAITLEVDCEVVPVPAEAKTLNGQKDTLG